MKGTTGVSTLDAIRRPVLPPLPHEIVPSSQAPSVASIAAAPTPETAPVQPIPAPVAPPVAAQPSVASPPAALTPPPIPAAALAAAPPPNAPYPNAAPPVAQPPVAQPPVAPPPVAPGPAIEEPGDTVALDGLFPPTAEEMAAKMQADQEAKLEAQAAAAAEKEAEMAARLTRSGRKQAKKAAAKADKIDLRPPGPSPFVRKALNVIAVLAVVAVAYAGFLFYQRVSAATLVTQLEAGECVTDFFTETEGQFRNVFVVDTTSCENPHAYEVFSTAETVFADAVELDSGYPGVEATFAIGQEFCRAEYDTFVGGDFATSPWQVWTFVPTETRWDRGERKVQCLVGDATETQLVEGTLEGADR